MTLPHSYATALALTILTMSGFHGQLRKQQGSWNTGGMFKVENQIGRAHV